MEHPALPPQADRRARQAGEGRAEARRPCHPQPAHQLAAPPRQDGIRHQAVPGLLRGAPLEPQSARLSLQRAPGHGLWWRRARLPGKPAHHEGVRPRALPRPPPGPGSLQLRQGAVQDRPLRPGPCRRRRPGRFRRRGRHHHRPPRQPPADRRSHQEPQGGRFPHLPQSHLVRLQLRPALPPGAGRRKPRSCARSRRCVPTTGSTATGCSPGTSPTC
jgi:hypothetical protein